MKSTQKRSRNQLILSMCIFATIGIVRRFIPLSSSLVALVRGIIGGVFLLIVMLLGHKHLDKEAVKKNFWLLICSGTAIGFNWILLFEAYNHTTVATATLCYYLAPILVVAFSPIILKEKITWRKLICTLSALFGMVLVSGVLDAGIQSVQELKGILLGIGAAVLYASVILMNKIMCPIGSYDKTSIQLIIASIALLPYVLITEDLSVIQLTPLSGFLLLVAGIVHTGWAYKLYFGSMDGLEAHTIALLSYIDPILAIILSMVVLREPMSCLSVIGAVLILGAAYISEQ